MTTKSFHDIYDLVELIQLLENGSIEIHMRNGFMSFEVSHYTKDANGLPDKYETYKLNGDSSINGFLENTDRAYREIEEKMTSGKWKKNDDCT